MLKILITAPSLDENENVSGISTMVRTIINNNKSTNRYIHYRVGKRDGERKGLKWAFNQVVLAPSLLRAIVKHKIDLVYLNTDLTRASILRDYFLFSTAKRLLGKKVLLHIHGGHFLMSPPSPGSPFTFMIRSMLRGAGLCVVLSEIEQEAIKKNYGVSGVALPNAIEVSALGRKEKYFNEKLRIIFLGRIVASKGVHVIADAMKQLKQLFSAFEFHIYGSGPELDSLLGKLSSVEGLDFTYNGVAKGKDKWLALENAHLFLLPSLFGEGLPIAMLEAMGQGCIPIVSDDASISTVVTDSVNGCIVKKGDSNHLGSTIQKLLYNRNILPAMSSKAQSTIRSSYDIDSYVNRLNQYCASI
jgi:glycosyltransferase involved in cell wall biosynthesis